MRSVGANRPSKLSCAALRPNTRRLLELLQNAPQQRRIGLGMHTGLPSGLRQTLRQLLKPAVARLSGRSKLRSSEAVLLWRRLDDNGRRGLRVLKRSVD
jgi:hypothetical protein